ncbi:MAG: restriction endonuclease subunit S [Methylococcaceae bacterium]|nr:restriction endonuclease subunit S [Methylococcaceae bacterium]
MQAIDLKNLDKSNWQTYRFDQIAKNISERVDPNNTDLKVYIGLEHIDSDSIHIKRNGTPDDVNGQKLRCYPGDVIFGRRRAYQRKAAIATVDGFCSAHSLVLRANTDVIDPKLFPFFMHSDAFMHRAIDISVGSLSPTINWGTLKHQEFLLPPKHQQAQLAELLWAMDDVIENRNHISEISERLIKSIFFDLINNGKKSRFKPKSFDEITLENLAVSSKNGLRRGPFGSALRKEFFVDSGIKIYEQSNVISNDFDTGDYFIASDKFEKLKMFEISAGDILVSCSGTIGKVAIVPNGLKKGIMNQALLRIRLNTNIVDHEYFKFLFESEIMQLKLLQKTQGSAMKNLVALKDMKKIKFPIVDKQTQENITSAIKSQIKISTSPILSSKLLQKSLINQIF